MLGIIDFFNSDINAALVGSATKDINRKYKVSSEKVAYILDATAGPVSTFGPVSDWIGYQVSLISAGLIALGVTGVSAYSVFLHSMPFNIYCVLAFLGVPMIIMNKDFGPMADAELRAKKTGKLIADGDSPMSSLENDLGKPIKTEKSGIAGFLVPIIGMLAVVFYGMWYTGGGKDGASIIDWISNCDVSIALSWGAFTMVILAAIFALRQGFMISEVEKTLFNGFKSILPSNAIIVCARSIGSV